MREDEEVVGEKRSESWGQRKRREATMRVEK
jgi:hypothetical protein